MCKAEVAFRREVQSYMEGMLFENPKLPPEDVVLQTAIDFRLPEVLVFDGRSWLWARERLAEQAFQDAWDYASDMTCWLAD